MQLDGFTDRACDSLCRDGNVCRRCRQGLPSSVRAPHAVNCQRRPLLSASVSLPFEQHPFTAFLGGHGEKFRPFKI